jgi:hypothetical protein
VADFWSAALGWKVVETDEGIMSIGPGDGTSPTIDIVAVPETKTVKNRMHLDVFGSTDELVALGATVVRRRDDEIEWDVLADPEGNEFCLLARRVDA